MESHPTNKALTNRCSKDFEEGETSKHVPPSHQTTNGEETSIATHISHTPNQDAPAERLASSMAQRDCDRLAAEQALLCALESGRTSGESGGWISSPKVRAHFGDRTTEGHCDSALPKSPS